MKKYRKLLLKHPNQELIEMLCKMKSRTGMFYYDDARSKDYAFALFQDAKSVGCFRTSSDELMPAFVWLVIVSGELKVTNITPVEVGSLGVSNYNKILMSFFDEMIKPFIDESWKDCILISGENVSLNEMLPKDTFDLLSLWEENCDKSAPISHPNDYERWLKFVVSLYNSDVNLSVEDFEKWLSEDCQWPSGFNESIDEMGEKLEYSFDLLKAYGSN